MFSEGCRASGWLWWKLGDKIPGCLSIIHIKLEGLPFLFLLETDKTKMTHMTAKHVLMSKYCG